MKAIHGGKAKNDRIDAAQDRRRSCRAASSRMAYVYPQGQARDPRPAPPPHRSSSASGPS